MNASAPLGDTCRSSGNPSPAMSRSARDTAMVALFTLVAFVAAACSPVTSRQYQAVPLGGVTGHGQWVRFDMIDGSQVEMKVIAVEFPLVAGVQDGRRVGLDLRNVKSLAIGSEETDNPATVIKQFAVGTGVYGAILVGIAIIVLLTKTSCPFFYMEDSHGGLQLVGEAYSGAAFRSIARDDLLPTPLPPGPRARARFSNQAHETQYTDRLELVVFDHSPDVRVLSTFDARAIAVGPAEAPLEARDQDGRDVRDAVQAADDRLWQTDLVEMAGRSAPPSLESLELTFAAEPRSPGRPPSGGVAVLELSLGNTPWIDAVMGRFFALMGSHLEGFLRDGNDSTARGRINAWREREGVDLRVDVEVGGSFHPVAVIPTVGPMALRRVAVPLPVEATRDGRPVRVRLRGGLGFWRVDEAAMSWQSPLDAEAQRIAPASARDPAGRDWRGALRAADGDSHVLGDRGDLLDLSFELPPVPKGRERTAFLLTHGYYNVHRPPGGDFSPFVLRDLRDHRGALAAFGLDLFRGYMRLLAESGSR
jgi:hypothetical protein